MTLGTHVAFASVLYLGGATLFGYTPGLIGGLLIVVTSILPDIDHPRPRSGGCSGSSPCRWSGALAIAP